MIQPGPRAASGQGSELLLAAGALGFVSIAAQVTLLREFLAVLEGNELVFGIILSTWMLLTGLGALYARYCSDPSRPGRQLLVISFLPLLTALGVRYLRNALFTPGVMLGLAETLAFGVIMLAPLCIAGGVYFVRLTQLYSLQHKRGAVSSVYGCEALGSILGAFTGVLLSGFVEDNTTVLITILVAGAALSAGLSARPAVDRITLACAALLIVGSLGARAYLNLNVLSREPLFPGQSISVAKDTPYGSLVVTHQDGQSSFFENGILLFSTDDVVHREEAVHFAMAQRASPETVLVIAGGVGGVLDEVLKYRVKLVDYVEVNPWIIGVGRENTPALSDPRVRLVIADGRRHLRESQQIYDVVLVNTPDPATAQANRFYTEEFFRSARRRMNPSSVLAISLLPSVEYYGPAARDVVSSVYKAQSSAFGQVLAVPGSRNYLLSSDSSLDIRISRLVERRGIPTVAVNAYYVDDALLAERNTAFMKSLNREPPRNTDLRPVVYYHHVTFWLEALGIPPGVVGGAAVALVLAIFAFSSPPGTALFTAGFVGAAVEMMLLLAFQCLFGVIYQSMGLIFGGFMAGLTIGALAARKIQPVSARRYLAATLGVAAGETVVIAVVLSVIGGSFLPDAVSMVLFVVMAGGIGAATGFAFGAAAAINTAAPAKIAGPLYWADLSGSALGSMCAGVFLIPLGGLGIAAAVVTGLTLIPIPGLLVRRAEKP